MAVSHYTHRWTLDDFLRAWDAGFLDKRSELLDGEVWDMPIGEWHAETTGTVIRVLPNGTVKVLAGSLAAGQSLPEPDCWVRRIDASPIARLSPRMSRWAAEDVLLVVEISDETRDYDLGRKADLYAEAGFPTYWCITPQAVYTHSGPTPTGYTTRTMYNRGQQVTVPYGDGSALDVDRLIGG